MKCDNVQDVHEAIVIAEDENALRAYCTKCHAHQTIRKDYRGVPENRSYSEFFRKMSIQPNHPLFYKVYPQYLNL